MYTLVDGPTSETPLGGLIYERSTLALRRAGGSGGEVPHGVYGWADLQANFSLNKGGLTYERST